MLFFSISKENVCGATVGALHLLKYVKVAIRVIYVHPIHHKNYAGYGYLELRVTLTFNLAILHCNCF